MDKEGTITYKKEEYNETALILYKEAISKLLKTGQISLSTASRLINKMRKTMNLPYLKQVLFCVELT